MSVFKYSAFRTPIVAAISSVLVLASPVAAEERFKQILMVTENEGTIREKVVEFKINPEVKDRLANMRSFVSDRGLRQMTDAQTVSNRDAMQKA
ncbi:MAG: hypothetical protein V7695_18850, partial [Sulfitobacter sp.]